MITKKPREPPQQKKSSNFHKVSGLSRWWQDHSLWDRNVLERQHFSLCVCLLFFCPFAPFSVSLVLPHQIAWDAIVPCALVEKHQKTNSQKARKMINRKRVLSEVVSFKQQKEKEKKGKCICHSDGKCRVFTLECFDCFVVFFKYFVSSVPFFLRRVISSVLLLELCKHCFLKKKEKVKWNIKLLKLLIILSYHFDFVCKTGCDNRS